MFLPFASACHVLVHVGCASVSLWCQLGYLENGEQEGFDVTGGVGSRVPTLQDVNPATLFFSHAQLIYKPNIKLSVCTWDNLLSCVHSAVTHTMTSLRQKHVAKSEKTMIES